MLSAAQKGGEQRCREEKEHQMLAGVCGAHCMLAARGQGGREAHKGHHTQNTNKGTAEHTHCVGKYY